MKLRGRKLSEKLKLLSQTAQVGSPFYSSDPLCPPALMRLLLVK